MTLLAQVRSALRAVADPVRAPQMQAYMKSAMPYHGVSAPVLRATMKALLADHPFRDAAQWRSEVLALWRGAKFREERYAAMALTKHRSADAFQTLDTLPMYQELITTGAWWDYVDELAANRVGPLLAAFPKPMAKTLRGWANGSHLEHA